MMDQNNNTVPVELLVTKYFVKYTRLTLLVSNVFRGSKATEINLYIDLYGLYKTLFSRSYRTDVSDYTSFTSSIINMCIHYRTFFKGIGVRSNIFIVSSYNIPEINRKFVANYNKTFVEKYKNELVREMIELNRQLLEILCPYLPDIYFFTTEFESTVMIDYLIRNEISKGNKNPNIILSSDIYPMQLCSLYDDTTFLKPKKSFGEDLSILTYPRTHQTFKQSFWSIICGERDNLASDANTMSISPCNYMLLEALNRFPERNLENIVNISTASKIIHNIVGEESTKLNPDLLFTYSKEVERISKSKVESRYKTLDIDFQRMLFDESIESKMITYENLVDPDAIKLIGSQYFQSDPIDFLKL